MPPTYYDIRLFEVANLLDDTLGIGTIPKFVDLFDHTLRIWTIPEFVYLLDHTLRIWTIPEFAYLLDELPTPPLPSVV